MSRFISMLPIIKTGSCMAAFWLLLKLIFISSLLPSCSNNDMADENDVAEGLIKQYGCGSCHSIPGIDWADARVGPPLHNYRKRAYIAGMQPNTTDNLVKFLMEPESVNQQTAMPNVGLSQTEATAIAQYLYDATTD